MRSKGLDIFKKKLKTFFMQQYLTALLRFQSTRGPLQVFDTTTTITTYLWTFKENVPKEAKLASIHLMKRAIKPCKQYKVQKETKEALNRPTRLDF